MPMATPAPAAPARRSSPSHASPASEEQPQASLTDPAAPSTPPLPPRPAHSKRFLAAAAIRSESGVTARLSLSSSTGTTRDMTLQSSATSLLTSSTGDLTPPQTSPPEPAAKGAKAHHRATRGHGAHPPNGPANSAKARRPLRPEREFKPAAVVVRPPRRALETAGSLRADDVFADGAAAGGSPNPRDPFNSSATSSDASSLFGATHDDKAQLLSGLDEVLGVTVGGHPPRGHKYKAGDGHRGFGTGGPYAAAPPSDRSSAVSDHTSGTLPSSSQVTNDSRDPGTACPSPGMIPPVFKTIRSNSSRGNQQWVHVDGGGDDSCGISANLGFKDRDAKAATPGKATSGGILKKTKSRIVRRASHDSGGQDSKGSKGSKGSDWRGRFRRTSFEADNVRPEDGRRRRHTHESQAAEVHKASGLRRATAESLKNHSAHSLELGSGVASRRGSDTSSATLTGFQVLRASLQSVRHASSSTIGTARSRRASEDTDSPGARGSSGGSGSGLTAKLEQLEAGDALPPIPVRLSVSERNAAAAGFPSWKGDWQGGSVRTHLSDRDDCDASGSCRSGLAPLPPHWSRWSRGRGGEGAVGMGGPDDALSRSGRCRAGRRGSGGAMDVLNHTLLRPASPPRDPDGAGRADRDGAAAAGGRRPEGGEEGAGTVAAEDLGGTAYLRASRQVWTMRIIVVVTFVALSVMIYIVPTYTFIPDMEEDVWQQMYSEISTMLAADTAKSLDLKASMARALSRTYTGVLGAPPGATACAADGGWPNVTLSGFDEIATTLLGASESRAAVFAPLLWGEAAAVEWETYATGAAVPLVEDVVSDGIRSNDGGSDSAISRDSLSSLLPAHPSLQVPAWQVAPAVLAEGGIMWDYYSHPPYRAPIERILKWNREGETTEDGSRPLVAATELMPCNDTLLALRLATVDPIQLSGPGSDNVDRFILSLGPEAKGVCSAVFYPVYDTHPSVSAGPDAARAGVSGVVAEVFSWSDVFMDIYHGQVHDVALVVVESKANLPDGSSSSSATFLVRDDGASFVGHGRHVEEKYEEMGTTYNFSFPNDDMVYSFQMYPTEELRDSLGGWTNTRIFLAIIAACFFFLSVLVFFMYDYLVNSRQKVVAQSAAQSARIVHSLYPQFVRDKAEVTHAQSNRELYDDEDPHAPGGGCSISGISTASQIQKRGLRSKVSDFVDTPATQLKRFLMHPMASKEYDFNLCTNFEREPIAEVFEKTTVMLADIEGFTAWCSEREPSQVFRLLETVYREFDIEARKLGVFKVETVGDCYVAVTGLPDPIEDHAIVIAKYAVRCLLKFNVLTKRLEANLGPGTASLGMRFGLHSGPVTAGVLRGEKSRFQLFGDTINVASRMESTGEKNMIQVSQSTSDLLTASGKGHWLTPRDGPVSAKGKGSIKTYWLQPNRRRPSMHGSLRQSAMSDSSSSLIEPAATVSLDRALRQSWKCIGIENDSMVAKERLIRWNAAILESFLLKIVDNRNIDCAASADELLDRFVPSPDDKHLSFSEKLSESVMFPDVAYRDDYYGTSGSDIAISSEAQLELLEYVARIASMYRDVPFHNFDHASHVTMSANKLLNRVCTTFEDEEEDISSVAERTFGISADPLAQFVVVFSSLVHDVDHQGVPNAILVKENDPLATQYEKRSVAEKRSISVAWSVLMEDRFRELQSLIFVNGDEMRRFKQLLINTVLATDIADKERSKRGKIRWQKAFHPESRDALDDDNISAHNIPKNTSLRSLKATLVFEQIMQASDVAHTMQHWETFKKWNKRLYKELSKGHREGRGAFDPRDGWYNGEIGFFDFYIIPLAKKLKECGVFGSATREYLDYALENRRRWEEEGTEIARKMVADNDEQVANDALSASQRKADKAEEAAREYLKVPIESILESKDELGPGPRNNSAPKR